MADNCLFNKETIEERLRQLEELEEAFNAGKQGYASFKVYCEKKSEQAFKEFSKFKAKEQQSKRDWQVESFIGSGGMIYEKTSNDDSYTCFENFGHGKKMQNQLLDDGYKIHSVRRISDGEIFVVGDETTKGIIKEFWIDEDINYLFAKFTDGKSLQWKFLKKVEKPKYLFVTEDGVGIFDTDCYYSVSKDFCHSGVSNGLFWYNPKSGEKYFSTKEAAEEYIIMNKPMLSLQEVNDYSYIAGDKEKIESNKHYQKLRQLVKDKLNKK